MKNKICSKCKIIKSIEEFYCDKNQKDRLTCRCRECIKQQYLPRPKQFKFCLICKKEFILYNGNQKFCSEECFNEYRKEYNKKRSKLYYKIHRKKLLEQQKIYQNKHKKEFNRYIKNRMKTDINFKLRRVLRSRIWYALKRNIKSEVTMKLIGCSIDHLKQHLQKLFKTGMTWENMGKWHIDHIKPCALFDLFKLSEQHKCFNWKNLQPLWVEENMSKGAK
jgi:predicted nucleic acid-binding Zn ribbon protein